MTIECYYATCPNHSIHTDPDDGPFCYLDHCTATKEEAAVYKVDRQKQLEAYKAKIQQPE